jgi:predicted ester cyclase
MSGDDDPAAIGRAYFEAVGRQDVDAMAALWEPGSIDELHGLVSLRAPDEIREWFGNLFTAVPDYRFEILDLVASGEKVAVRWRASGTFDGPARLEGLLPTSAEIDLTGCDVLTVREGKIRHNDAYVNGAEMARQLGALPPQGSFQERAMTGALNLKTRAVRLLRR